MNLFIVLFLLPSVTFPLQDPNILLRILFSNTLTILNVKVKEQTQHVSKFALSSCHTINHFLIQIRTLRMSSLSSPQPSSSQELSNTRTWMPEILPAPVSVNLRVVTSKACF